MQKPLTIQLWCLFAFAAQRQSDATSDFTPPGAGRRWNINSKTLNFTCTSTMLPRWPPVVSVINICFSTVWLFRAAVANNKSRLLNENYDWKQIKERRGHKRQRSLLISSLLLTILGLLLNACSGDLMSLLQVFVMDLSFPQNCIECPTKDKDGSQRIIITLAL